MNDPEYNSKVGMCIVPTSSSTVGVMQTNRVFCDFDLSTQYNSIHDIKDILLEIEILNNDPNKILYLTSTYAFYDLIQIMIDDNIVEEIRSDNAFIDHQFYDSDTLSKYSLLEGFGDRLVRPVPSFSFIPYNPISVTSSEKLYIIVPPNCISNKNIPLPLLSSCIKLRIYFKTKPLVLSNYDGTAQTSNGSTDFLVTSLSSILVGNKYDENTLNIIRQKYAGKSTVFDTLTHVWKTTSIGKPTTNTLEYKVSINGSISDISFFIRDSDTSGVKAAQFNVSGANVIQPFSLFRLTDLTLKDSNSNYTNFYSNISGKVLNLINDKYNKINSSWNSIFPIYTFKFSNELFDTIATGKDNGSCMFNGNFNIVFNTVNDLSISPYINNSVDLIMVAHQYKKFILDPNGKLHLSKN